MLRKSFIFCVLLAVVLVPWNTEAASYAPCTTIADCKISMAHEMKFEYYGAVYSLLARNLDALYYAFRDYQRQFEKGTEVYTKVDADFEIINLQKGIVEDTEHFTADKMQSVVRIIKGLQNEIFEMDNQVKIVNDLKEDNRREKKKFFEAVIENWPIVIRLARGVDMSQLVGFNEIGDDVKKAKELGYSEGTQQFYMDLVSRMLKFFNITNSEIFYVTKDE